MSEEKEILETEIVEEHHEKKHSEHKKDKHTEKIRKLEAKIEELEELNKKLQNDYFKAYADAETSSVVTNKTWKRLRSIVSKASHRIFCRSLITLSEHWEPLKIRKVRSQKVS